MKLKKVMLATGLSVLLFSASSFAASSNQKAIDTLQKQIETTTATIHKEMAAQQTATQKAISDLQTQVQGQIAHIQTEMQQMQVQLSNEIKLVQAEAVKASAQSAAPVVTATPGVTEAAPAVAPAKP